MSFSVGDRVKCIDDGWDGLTLCKIYTVVDGDFASDHYIYIINDLGNRFGYKDYRFVLAEATKPTTNWSSLNKEFSS